ncbi:glucokinase [Ideonella livida]|uniref:Glucokinase n=1 Tax=Ideonella livida TaxID=2707176 RepID=A0A7C9TK65_9BURK|nr:glucokinase [Ideonella livida]NDY91443.1 glucokinase [Ideonella livida]
MQAGYPRLVGDIGGTNARFAVQRTPGGPLEEVRTLPVAQHASLEAAVRHYLSEIGLSVVQAGMGIANPVLGDQVRMTNAGWAFSIEAMRQSLGWTRFALVNDFTALALSLPHLSVQDVRQLGGGTADPRGPMALIGPGTGLGVSGLLPVGVDRWVPLAGEGGHVTLPAVTPREQAVVRWLDERFGHASAERAVSGQGLENLHEALCALDGVVSTERLSAAEVSRRALAQQDARCDEALELMLVWLGSVAGNLALTLGATGGVYLGGGIVPRLGDRLLRSGLRARFEAKGRFQPMLARIPLFVIDAQVSPALLGAAHALDE